jgi:hypothetical protein
LVGITLIFKAIIKKGKFRALWLKNMPPGNSVPIDLYDFICMQGVDEKIGIPIGFLALASGAYVVFIKKRYLSISCEGLEARLCLLLSLLPPDIQK